MLFLIICLVYGMTLRVVVQVLCLILSLSPKKMLLRQERGKNKRANQISDV